MVRRISWIKAALMDFQAFPAAVQEQMTTALRVAAHGEKADKAKPMKGLGSRVFEIALAYRGNAYRAVYTVQVEEDVWVVHAFQKKSTQGIKTPKREIDLIRTRLKRLQEMLP
jgi:phage-related protein